MITHERFGLLTSIIGLVADLIALATVGYGIVHLDESESTVSIIFWLGMFSIIPLTYFWGYLTWLVNLKFGHRHWESTLTVGISLAPFYLVWGFLILGEPRREEIIMDWELAGYITFTVFWTLLIQLILGFIIAFVVHSWNFLLSQRS